MVGADLAMLAIQKMSPQLQSKHHRCQLKIIRRVILLIILQLPQNISNYSTMLHQDTSKTAEGGIVVDHKSFPYNREGKDRS